MQFHIMWFYLKYHIKFHITWFYLKYRVKFHIMWFYLKYHVKFHITWFYLKFHVKFHISGSEIHSYKYKVNTQTYCTIYLQIHKHTLNLHIYHILHKLQHLMYLTSTRCKYTKQFKFLVTEHYTIHSNINIV